MFDEIIFGLFITRKNIYWLRCRNNNSLVLHHMVFFLLVVKCLFRFMIISLPLSPLSALQLPHQPHPDTIPTTNTNNNNNATSSPRRNITTTSNIPSSHPPLPPPSSCYHNHHSWQRILHQCYTSLWLPSNSKASFPGSISLKTTCSSPEFPWPSHT